MKRLWRIFRTGLVAIVPFALLAFLFASLFEIIFGFLNLFGNAFGVPVLDSALKFFLLFVCIFVLGLLVSWKFFRDAIARLSSRIPVVSDLVKIFFSDEYIERIREGNHRVAFWNPPWLGCGAFVAVTYETDEWASVFIPTSPLPMTGYEFVVRQEHIRKTDMTVQQLGKLNVAFGLNAGEILRAAGLPRNVVGEWLRERETPPKKKMILKDPV